MDTFNHQLHDAVQGLTTSFKRCGGVLPLFSRNEKFQKNCMLLVAFEKWRFQFCLKISSSLPQELRDMVYREIIDKHYTVRVFETPFDHEKNPPNCLCIFSERPYVRPVAERKIYNLPGQIIPKVAAGIEALFDHEITGASFSHELIETFYSRATLELSDPSLVAAVMDHRISGGQEPINSSCYWRIALWGTSDTQSQVAPLERLRKLPASPTVRIHLIFCDYAFSVYKHTLMMLGPLLFDLKAQNKAIKLAKRDICARRLLHSRNREECNGSECGRDSTWLLENSLGEYLDVIDRAEYRFDISRDPAPIEELRADAGG